MHKRGSRLPVNVRFTWGNGRKGSQSLYTPDEAARLVDDLKSMAVIRRTSIEIRYTHKDTGADLTSRFDFTDRLPLRGEPGSDESR